ncbi:hypothetical protein BH20ACI4_BH20ACI4_09320 [soil metagenome]
MNNKVVAGIDIGGTKIAVALQDLNKKIVASECFSTQVDVSPMQMLESIEKEIERMLAETRTTLSQGINNF